VATDFEIKLLQLLNKIDEGEYPANLLRTISQLQSKVQTDTGSATIDEGMAMLGYLLKKRYVFIHDIEGIKLTEDKVLRKTLRGMIKDFKK